MTATERVPHLDDLKLIHNHIDSLLRTVRRPEKEEWGQFWVREDLSVIQRIATGSFTEPTRDRDTVEGTPIGWNPRVCDAIVRVAKVAEELSKSWRWRSGNNRHGIPKLVLGEIVIEFFEWARSVFAEAIDDATREEEENDRDTFIYRQRLAGRSRKQIRTMVNELAAARGWRTLNWDQQISRAVRRIAERDGQNRSYHK
jgi:hypothetical protein